MKVLITGGCGFLGSNIAASFIRDGIEVIIIDALYRVGAAENLEWLLQRAASRQVTHHKIDLADAEAVSAVFERHAPIDYVCHLGGQVAMTTSLRDPRRDFLTNALGTFNVLEEVRRWSPDALVAYSSTNKVYGDLAHLEYLEMQTRYTVPAFPNGFTEDLPLDFASPYGCSKGAADQYMRDWSRSYGLRTVVFRHSSIYGGRQYATSDQGWIGWFCQKGLEQQAASLQCVEPQSFTIAGSGKQVRDVLHAHDLVALYRAAWNFKDECCGQIFNIGGGAANSLSLLELFNVLKEELDISLLRFDCGPRRQSDQDYFVADIAKAKKLLNWTPKVDARQGIRQMLDWTTKAMNVRAS